MTYSSAVCRSQSFLPAAMVLHRSTMVKFALMLLGVSFLLLSACSLAPPRQKQELPLAERVPLEPMEQHEFVLRDVNQEVVGEPQIIISRWEDTFPDIARAYGLGYDELVAANPDIDPWLPGEGKPILLPTQYVLPDGPREGLVLNVAAKRLFYFPPVTEGDPAWVMTYPIGIGRVGWETPLGQTKVVAKATDPSWHVPASVRKEHAQKGDPLPAVVPPGPDNPLGRHTLRLQMPSYLIHGTNKPYGVGMRVSHGCIRLYPENIEQLYGLVDVSESVVIVNQPYLLAWRHGELYLEAHTPLEDDKLSPEQRWQSLLAAAEAESGAFPDPTAEALVLAIVEAARGVPVRVLQEDVEQVPRRARLVRNILPEEGAAAADAGG
jgi:L,D-transpeptidase ErfK/SrfK